jgi:putative membrane protein
VRELLHLPLRDLLLLGFLENKGMVLVGAAYGALWESGLMNWMWSGLFARTVDARGLFREVGAFLVGRGPLPAGRLALALGGLAAFLVLVRLVSMAWAVLRLHDFRLTRVGDDLRVTYGFFTRVAATIPLRRVQTVTVRRGWLHRALGLASIRVETAGGTSGAATRDREWVAPLVREGQTRALLAEVLAVATPDEGWQRVHPRAFRRAVKRVLLTALIPIAALGLTFGWPVAILGVPMLIWLVAATRQHVRHLAWLASDVLVAFRSGWWSRAETFVRVNRVQNVTLVESPFDRRARMSGVRVDTAGSGEWSHRVDIPYLDASVARDLLQRVSTAAARTDFHW